MNTAERAYEILLRAYPARFRAKFGREMLTVFNDRRREMRARTLQFWAGVLWDVAQSAPALQLESVRERRGGHTQTQGGTMKTMAILAMLIGTLEVVNSMVEGYLGGVVNHGGASLMGGAVGIIAGALLFASAVALLKGSPSAGTLARSAAVTCFAVFLGVALVQPMFSIMATALGIGFPVVMLLYLAMSGSRGASSPGMI
ncbi:MAG: hypothetical protein JWM95_1022 [Gemmatimonadetes bacterium]|nr:hypothetical protein [Gemmatimonadota bacterium]